MPCLSNKSNLFYPHGPIHCMARRTSYTLVDTSFAFRFPFCAIDYAMLVATSVYRAIGRFSRIIIASRIALVVMLTSPAGPTCWIAKTASLMLGYAFFREQELAAFELATPGRAFYWHLTSLHGSWPRTLSRRIRRPTWLDPRCALVRNAWNKETGAILIPFG